VGVKLGEGTTHFQTVSSYTSNSMHLYNVEHKPRDNFTLLCNVSRDTGIATRIRAGRPRGQGSISFKGKIFSFP
jgi:hypothetical protein